LLSLVTAIPTLGQQPAAQPSPVEIKIDPGKFDPYVGQYEDSANLGGTIFSIFREGDKFYLQVTNQDRIEIFPSAENKFFLKEIPASVEFVRDASGRATGMIWRQGGSEYRTKKIADQPAKDARAAFKRTEAMIPMRGRRQALHRDPHSGESNRESADLHGTHAVRRRGMERRASEWRQARAS
jgi:hypothetical protein